jgi:hypothetical protein
MDKQKIQKPTLFISHATSDAEFANLIKQEIERVFANGLDVFCTSSPGAISAGSDWLMEIEHNLSVAQAIIAIVTPTSIERSWLWFEIGAAWLKGRSGECRIYPICTPEVNHSKLPAPLDRLQALSIGKPQDIKALFTALIEQFGVGSLSALREERITKGIPDYSKVELVKPDLDDQNLAQGTELFTFPVGYTKDRLGKVQHIEIALSWDFLFGFFGGCLFESDYEPFIQKNFKEHLAAILPDKYVQSFPNKQSQELQISNAVIQQMEMQFMALGLIKQSSTSYWKLTPYGKSYLLKVKPIRSKVL